MCHFDENICWKTFELYHRLIAGMAGFVHVENDANYFSSYTVGDVQISFDVSHHHSFHIRPDQLNLS